MGTNDLSLGPSACPYLKTGRRSKLFDMDGKLCVTLDTIVLAVSETRESVTSEIKLTTDSAYLTGTNLTYSGARGSSALKIGVTYSGLGGCHGAYIRVDTSGAQVADGHGVIGLKCVVVNTAALSDGEVYGAQFIVKHNHASNVMLAQASLIGLEAWAYISDAGPARTVIGANFAIHNECSGTPGAGSVHRVLQLVCDNAVGAVVAEEATGICVWEMAGTWHNAIKIVASVTPFTRGLYILDASTITAIEIGSCTKGINFTGECSGGYFMVGTDDATLEDSGAVADQKAWVGLGIFTVITGAPGRKRYSTGWSEDHGINVVLQEDGEAYFGFAIQGRYTIQAGGLVNEVFGLSGRARVNGTATCGQGATAPGQLIGVFGEADMVSGAVMDLSGAGIAAGGRFTFDDNGATWTTYGKRCAVSAEWEDGMADCVLYLLKHAGADAGGHIIEVNDAGQDATDLLKLNSATDAGTQIGAWVTTTHNADGSLKIDIAGATYYIPVYASRYSS